MTLTLLCDVFDPDAGIPARHTCDGEDVSPPLHWDGVPAGTRSLALIVDDPDAPDPKAPQRTWVHWVVFNISPETKGLPMDAARAGLPAGAVQALNDWRRNDYGGPCPPIGRHRYFHKLFALDISLDPAAVTTKAQLLDAMQGHIVDQAELIGTYQRHR